MRYNSNEQPRKPMSEPRARVRVHYDGVPSQTYVLSAGPTHLLSSSQQGISAMGQLAPLCSWNVALPLSRCATQSAWQCAAAHSRHVLWRRASRMRGLAPLRTRYSTHCACLCGGVVRAWGGEGGGRECRC